MLIFLVVSILPLYTAGQSTGDQIRNWKTGPIWISNIRMGAFYTYFSIITPEFLVFLCISACFSYCSFSCQASCTVGRTVLPLNKRKIYSILTAPHFEDQHKTSGATAPRKHLRACTWPHDPIWSVTDVSGMFLCCVQKSSLLVVVCDFRLPDPTSGRGFRSFVSWSTSERTSDSFSCIADGQQIST